ncbi:unnamed protein product [Caenorhabditis brenneri]
MLIAISATLECCPPAASTRGGRLPGMAVDSGGGGENLLRNPYPRPAGPAVAENMAIQQPPPPASASSASAPKPPINNNNIHVEEKEHDLQSMAPATVHNDVAPPSTHHQEEQKVQQLSSVPTTCDAFGAAPFRDQLIDSFNTTATSQQPILQYLEVPPGFKRLAANSSKFLEFPPGLEKPTSYTSPTSNTSSAIRTTTFNELDDELYNYEGGNVVVEKKPNRTRNGLLINMEALLSGKKVLATPIMPGGITSTTYRKAKRVKDKELKKEESAMDEKESKATFTNEVETPGPNEQKEATPGNSSLTERNAAVAAPLAAISPAFGKFPGVNADNTQGMR